MKDLEFTFFIVGSDGSPVSTEFPIKGVLNELPRSLDCELEKIRNGKILKPGDKLRIQASFKVGASDVVLPLDLTIVAEPVIPAPEAAYAILRRTNQTDECVRFAWGPNPDRIELVDPDDLFGEVVRRRAVYTSIDVLNLANAGTTRYALQKTTPGGATHFPAITQQSTC